MGNKSDDWLTPKQAAEALDLTDSSVRRLILDGVLPAWKPSARVTLIKRSDVEKARDRPKVGNPHLQPKLKRNRR